MLSHELRNPLAAVLHASTALDAEPPVELARRCRQAIKRQATHIKHLLDDLLDVSRITADKFVLERDQVDLRGAIETAIEATQPLFKECRVQLACDVPPRQLLINGDARRLAQVICNLLANAATYSPPNTKITLNVSARDREIVLQVRDQGDGIAPDLLPHIFDLFVQSDQKLDRARGGLGLGLSLAKKIVDLHGGTITARSEGPGKGSEFEVRLPTMVAKVDGHQLPAKEAHAGPCRIVLVDDQEDSREMLKVLFEAKNHVVFDGEDGAHAIQLVAEHRPDVAFIDIGLPVLNGFEVAQQIRRHPELKDVVLVALTGYGNTQDIQRALDAGFDMHVTKPAELRTLEQILARARSGLKTESI